MDAQAIPLKTTGRRFMRTVRNFAQSEVGWKAKLIFAALVLLLLAANALNVANSFVGRNFMTAIADRDMPGFIRQAFIYVGVFAALTFVAVISRFGEERLGLLWRDTMTRAIVRQYLADGNYQSLKVSGAVANPDQRISEDVRAFTVTSLSFTLMGLNSAFTIAAFSEVLWTISPLLFGVAVLYAAGGSLFTIVLGRPLIRLNYDQLDKEAGFRSELIRVRDNSEAIMQARDEESQTARLLSRLDDLVANFRKITSINRNVGFFTTGYNWLIQIIPALIIAPAFIEGKVEFGVITQSAMAFTALVAAFSLIVTQFQSLSSFAAVMARLSALAEVVGQQGDPITNEPGLPSGR
jgi:vitamin B12/bleomycin/antimicrobial peptide transport system ATP-binding/permease protein